MKREEKKGKWSKIFNKHLANILPPVNSNEISCSGMLQLTWKDGSFIAKCSYFPKDMCIIRRQYLEGTIKINNSWRFILENIFTIFVPYGTWFRGINSCFNLTLLSQMASSRHVGHGSYFIKKNREGNEKLSCKHILVNQLSSLVT